MQQSVKKYNICENVSELKSLCIVPYKLEMKKYAEKNRPFGNKNILYYPIAQSNKFWLHSSVYATVCS